MTSPPRRCGVVDPGGHCCIGGSLQAGRFRRGPLLTLAGLEEATSAWVPWYNNERLIHRLGRIPPAEAEAELLRYDRHG
jgi:transposase InsO family protein